MALRANHEGVLLGDLVLQTALLCLQTHYLARVALLSDSPRRKTRHPGQHTNLVAQQRFYTSTLLNTCST